MIQAIKEIVELVSKPDGELADALKAILEVLYRTLNIDRGLIYLSASPDGSDLYVSIGGDSQTAKDETQTLRDMLIAQPASVDEMGDRQVDTQLLRTLTKMLGKRFGMPVVYFPIQSSHGKGVVGLIAVYAQDVKKLHQDELHALEIAARVVSLKLEHWFYYRKTERSRRAIAAAKQEWERTVDMLPELILVVDRNGRVVRSNRTLEKWFSKDIKDIRGLDCHELMHPECEDESCGLRTLFEKGRKALKRRRMWEQEYQDPVLGRHFWVHIRKLYDDVNEGFSDADVHATLIIEDISNKKEIERLRDQYNLALRQKVKEATALLKKSNANLKRQIRAHIRDKRSLQESEARYATLANITQTGIYIVIDRKIVFCNRRFAGIFGKTPEELLGTPIEDLVTVPDLTDSSMGGLASKGIMCGPSLVRVEGPDGREIWLSQSATPIIYKGKAALLGNVIDNTDLLNIQHSLEESKQKLEVLYREYLDVQEKERHRIASDLHDGIGQTLTGIKLALENAIEDVEQLQDGPHERLREILKNLQLGIDEVRRTAMNLRPATLDHFGIIATLDWFCREFAKEAKGLKIEKSIEVEERDIPDDIKVSTFRIVQESFNNILKHAKASNVSLNLYIMDGHLVLLICDDGVGMEINKSSAFIGGLGLVSMRERAEFVQGRFHIDSAPGRGTRIKVEWPLSRRSSEDSLMESSSGCA